MLSRAQDLKSTRSTNYHWKRRRRRLNTYIKYAIWTNHRSADVWFSRNTDRRVPYSRHNNQIRLSNKTCISLLSSGQKDSKTRKTYRAEQRSLWFFAKLDEKANKQNHWHSNCTSIEILIWKRVVIMRKMLYIWELHIRKWVTKGPRKGEAFPIYYWLWKAPENG